MVADREELTTPVGPAAPVATASDAGFPALGRYVVVDVLGEGGMGVVYRALDPQLRRHVAAKVVRRTWLGREGEARLVREARAMARVSHPNVVTIFDVTPCDAGVVVAMELVEGVDLKTWLRRAPQPWSDVVDAFVKAGRGLAAVHDAGLTHRDFKPANVLVSDDGRVMVTDFGLALGTGGKGSLVPPSAGASDTASGGSGASSPSGPSESAADSLEQITRTGEVMGTPAYMAPEQRYGAPAEPRGDQYAFCIALWEGLCGARPPSDPPYERKPGAEVPPWPDPKGVPPALGDVLRRGLSTDPQARFGSMAQLLASIERACRPRRRWWWTAAAVVALAGGATAWAVTDERDDPCDGDPLAHVWGPDSRDSIAQAFAADGSTLASDSIDLVTADLDAYADAYAHTHALVCAAPEADRDLQLACLAGRRRSFAGVVDVLATADASTVQHGLDVTRNLPKLEACADASGLRGEVAPPKSPALAAAVAALDAIADRVELLTRAGQHAQALTLVAQLPEQAEATGYAPVHARALFARGALYAAMSRPEEGIVDLRRALEIAETAHDDRTAALAAGRLAFVLAWDLGRVDEGIVAGRQSLALAQRAEPDGRLVALAHAMLCVAQSAKGELDAAVEHADAALRWFGEHDDTFNRDNVRSELARIMVRRGDLAAAEELFDAVATSRRKTLPRSHADVANSISNLAAIRAQSGRLVEAEPLMQEGYELRLAALGPDHMATIDSLANLGHVHSDLGQVDLAERQHRESLEAYERVLGPEHPRVANALDALANDMDTRENFEEAVRLRRRAIEILVGLNGPDHPSLALHHHNLANSLQALGLEEEAARHRARVDELATDEQRAIEGW